MAWNDIVASELVFGVVECLAEHEQLAQPLSPELCGELCAGLLDIAEHVMRLEAIARSAGVLEPRDFAAAVRRLPTADRQAIARAALARAEGNVVRFPAARVAFFKPATTISGCFTFRDQPTGGGAA